MEIDSDEVICSLAAPAARLHFITSESHAFQAAAVCLRDDPELNLHGMSISSAPLACPWREQERSEFLFPAALSRHLNTDAGPYSSCQGAVPRSVTADVLFM